MDEQAIAIARANVSTGVAEGCACCREVEPVIEGLIAERDRLKEERDDWRATAEAAQNQGLLNALLVERREENERLRADVDRLRTALVTALLPLEALHAAEADGWALAPATKEAIREAVMMGRATLVPPTQEDDR
jgi:hypothetical protein